mgnify:FL=1
MNESIKVIVFPIANYLFALIGAIAYLTKPYLESEIINQISAILS